VRREQSGKGKGVDDKKRNGREERRGPPNSYATGPGEPFAASVTTGD